MGPVLIFDKSTLESLNPDEAMWLDQFYLSNITPLFFVETLADLEKNVRAGRKPEEVVGSIAYKTPDYSSKANVHHRHLLEGELFGGSELDMEHGRPHISGGKTVELSGKTGVFFEQAPEEEALQRWQEQRFLELERFQAKQWRKALSLIDLETTYIAFQSFFPIGKPRSLSQVKKIVDFHMTNSNPENTLTFGLGLVGVTEDGRGEILRRWRTAGKPELKVFAPYFFHIVSVDFFFNLAVAADLIGRGRATHKVDLAYLYYLPFCMVFTSSDKLHSEIAPFFLRENQSFIDGRDLKSDLAKLDRHYASSTTDTEKSEGVVSFASHPPKDEAFLTTRLWDKHMGTKWREHEFKMRPQPDSELTKKLREELQEMKKAPGIAPRPDARLDDAHSMVIKRKVRGSKGKWQRFPPEVMNRRETADGEWKDVPPEEMPQR